MGNVEPGGYGVKLNIQNEGGFEGRSPHHIPAFTDSNNPTLCDLAAMHCAAFMAYSQGHGREIGSRVGPGYLVI
jgi:hypothetical protein